MTLHPDCLKVHAIYAAAKRPPLESQTPAEAREGMLRARAIFNPDPPEMDEVRDLAAPGPAGQIPLRLYRPRGAQAGEALPCLVFYHGGGWVIGDLDSHDTLCRQLANASGAAVIAVHYRLAPEHRFPVAAEDAWAALQWISTNGSTLGIDAHRLAVGGDSAGGNLAAGVALMARDQKGPTLRLQLLIYPSVDFGWKGGSYDSEADVLPLTDKAMRWFQAHYCPDLDAKMIADPRLSPIRASRHDNLAPGFVLVAEHDVLRDEGEAYAKKLEAAGVPVQAEFYPGMIHGFITMGRVVADANKAVIVCSAALKGAFA